MNAETLDRQRSHVDICLVAGHIGAEVRGVDLTAPLDSVTVAEIRSALLRHKVLFFRDQRLDHGTHVAFARQFGKLTTAHPYQSSLAAEFPQVLTIDPEPNAEKYGESHEEIYRRRWRSSLSGWHTDLSPALNPPAACVLRAETVPSFGGDTHWTNLVAAYEGLSTPLRNLADILKAEHRFLAGFQMTEGDPEVDAIVQDVRKQPIATIHPVVRMHPETGERALFVNPSSTYRIVGMSSMESQYLLDLFFEQISKAQYTVRFRWEPGSVAFWDNRATAHLAAVDVGHIPQRRTLHRVTLLGDVPFGPDGKRSEPIHGQPFTALD